jgi:hypothetical protein
MNEIKAKRSVGRPAKYAGKRPTITFRLPTETYERVRDSAAQNQMSISEELERRVQRSFEWEAQFGDVKALMAQAEETMKKGLESAMRQAGYQRIRTDQGVIWAEPAMDASRLSVSAHASEIARALEPAIDQIVERAIARVLKKENEK